MKIDVTLAETMLGEWAALAVLVPIFALCGLVFYTAQVVATRSAVVGTRRAIPIMVTAVPLLLAIIWAGVNVMFLETAPADLSKLEASLTQYLPEKEAKSVADEAMGLDFGEFMVDDDNNFSVLRRDRNTFIVVKVED